jgi:SsrA-binding protein
MSAKKAAASIKKIVNRRARFDYELGDSLVVGLALTGPETKALRMGHGQLRGAYVAVKDNELWLIGAQVNNAPGLQLEEDVQLRSRKLLAKRREIDRLIELKKQGRTIVPLELLVNGRYIKLRISAGKGKKTYDKRETLKRRQQEREASRQLKT